jgi:hypothetical protein
LTVSFAAALEQAAKEAVCGWLANGGNAVAATWIVNGAKTPATAVAGAAGMLGLLALNYGCNYDPNKSTGSSDLFNSPCPGGTRWCARQDGHPSYGAWKNIVGAVADWDWEGFNANGNPVFRNKSTGQLFQATDWKKALNCQVGYGSQSPTPVMCTGAPVVPPGPIPDYTYTDPTTNCDYTVNFQGFLADGGGGAARPIMKITAGGPAATRASGGIIGGCNFEPILHIPGGGGGGGGITIPWTDLPDLPGGEPWWWDIVKGAGGAVLGGLINRLIEKLLEEKAPAITYRLVSVCEKDAQGEAISQSREVSIPSLPMLNGLVARVDAMDNLMQGLKDFKQPICEPEPPAAPVGRNISLQFRSDGPSPYGEKPLRKAFRYRDPSLKDLEEHREHWKDFEWESGPWMVISDGLLWGKPRVWAKSEAEGRRVLTHAAQIAGMNLNSSSHRWVVREVDGYRERPVMKMRVHRDVNGRLWIAERTGSDGLPMVLDQLSPDINVGP